MNTTILPRSRAGLTARLRVPALVLLAMAGAALAASAQDGNGEGEGRGYFLAGYMALDVDAMNASLSAAALPGLDGTALTLGGAGYGTRGRMLIGVEGHGILGGDETTADGQTQVSMGGGYGLFRVGFLAYQRDGLDIYPMLGVGGGGISVSIKERSAPVFDDVLNDPQRSASLSAGMFLLDVGLAVDYRFGIEMEEEEGEGGIVLGIQGGYTLAPGNPSWTLDGINTVAGGPELLIQGFYIRASIGGWGRESRQGEGS